ncbi:hypothetical protein BCR33DRAFT_799069 [Rhizoclosmatium globosum]|uniref:Uncharacterized protein n=1 Tax=Rhizoclosmatium globosum TaxID=329046 RepID=A0A1Y2AC80_9FUNG|nr:hypothetical protein BCR33DRAFT_799069 [Rhizoclosmatium globosum]|eukprot:ORY20102.1 hypothetical protein BCR33DRAFT_799069 [Rhizoclosmatium globosum]
MTRNGKYDLIAGRTPHTINISYQENKSLGSRIRYQVEVTQTHFELLNHPAIKNCTADTDKFGKKITNLFGAFDSAPRAAFSQTLKKLIEGFIKYYVGVEIIIAAGDVGIHDHKLKPLVEALVQSLKGAESSIGSSLEAVENGKVQVEEFVSHARDRFKKSLVQRLAPEAASWFIISMHWTIKHHQLINECSKHQLYNALSSKTQLAAMKPKYQLLLTVVIENLALLSIIGIGTLTAIKILKLFSRDPLEGVTMDPIDDLSTQLTKFKSLITEALGPVQQMEKMMINNETQLENLQFTAALCREMAYNLPRY